MCKQVLERSDEIRNLLMLVFDLLAFKGSQPAELHIQDGLRLKLAELKAGHQIRLRLIGILRFTDGPDDRVEVREGDQVSVEDMLAGARLCQLKLGTPDDDCLAMFDEDLQRLLERQRAGFPIDKRQHLDAKSGLQSRVLVKLVEDLLRLGAPLELDHDAHAALV